MKIDYIDPNNYGIVHTVLDEEHQELCWSLIKGNSPSPNDGMAISYWA